MVLRICGIGDVVALLKISLNEPRNVISLIFCISINIFQVISQSYYSLVDLVLSDSFIFLNKYEVLEL